MESVGTRKKKWRYEMDLCKISDGGRGICGFVSMVQLLIDNEKIQVPYNEQEIATKFAQEWVNTQIEHDKQVEPNVITALKSSLILTKDFTNYENYNNEKIKDIKQADGLALTPETICDYLLRRYGLTMEITIYDNKKISELWKSPKDHLGSGIYGLKKLEKKSTNKNQLSHYVYIDKKDNIMTWGDTNNEVLKSLNDKSYDEVVVKLSLIIKKEKIC